MPFKKLEVRGCCMGIPIGCGTLFTLVGLGAWQNSLLHFSATTVLATSASLFLAGLGVLFALGGRQETRLIPARDFTPSASGGNG